MASPPSSPEPDAAPALATTVETSTTTLPSSPSSPASDDEQPHLAPPSPAGHELKPVDTTTSSFSVGSQRELKPKREKDWRETFSPPADEELVETHGCALAKDILVHGRLFVSHSTVYFKSNILGFKTVVQFPLASVTAVEPRMTALVIPNAIEVTVAGGETYLFTTFNARDETLDLLLALWRAAAPDKFAAFEGAKDAAEAAEVRARAASVSSSSSKPAAAGGGADAVKTVHVEQTSSAGEHVEVEATQAVKSGAPGAGHVETSAEGIEEFDEVCMDDVYPCEPKTLFDLWYRDEKFVPALWEKLEFTEIDCPSFPAGENERDYSYVKPLKGSFGPSSTKCVFHDEIQHEEADKFFAVLTVTQTPNVPSGKSFKCKSMTTFTWAGANRGVRVRATSEVEWSGRSMIKGVVNSSSIAGQKEYNAALEEATRAHIKAHPELRLSGVDEQEEAAPVLKSESGDKKASAKPKKDAGGGGGGGSVLESLLDDPVKLVLGALVGVLLLSNAYLLLTRGSSAAGLQAFRGRPEVKNAMERLDRMEREWDGLRAHFSGGAGALTEPVAVQAVPVGVDSHRVKAEAACAAHRQKHGQH